MATPLVGTAIITGGDGNLGSEIAVAIARKQPLIHILVLVRDLSSLSVRQVSQKVRMVGPRSFEIARVDLNSFSSVITFAEHTIRRVRDRDIPPVAVLVNCAATYSHILDPKTVDGYDPVYQTNCLSPFLLTISLLESFRASKRTGTVGAHAINVGCSNMSHGRLDFFQAGWEAGRKEDIELDDKEALQRYGSSKLLLSATMYALRRSLVSSGNIPINISTFDPGSISSKANRPHKSTSSSPERPNFLNPLHRFRQKRSINAVTVSANAIADTAFRPMSMRALEIERYHIVGKEYEASSVVNVLRDQKQMNNMLNMALVHTRIGTGTPTNSSAATSPSMRSNETMVNARIRAETRRNSSATTSPSMRPDERRVK
ncbi:hypothetical protein AJ79_05245 [Helicocarpus griseus UAMH5409]|uniref:Ketoreductase (KR) domain-containing protein n=1 Tax=Helicocarpus griseus UAMH5409 TaxID=1447875 RepID=A0A2B7XPM3_9EURO|nr:hypothetical protein AJ79_05245 [Helicocarpus griseus UAMH5409]